MANIPKLLHRSALTNSTAPRTATVPAAKRWIITNVILCNYSATTRTATVTVGGVSIVNNLELPPSAVFSMDCAQVLDAAGVISAYADVGSTVAAHISGVESDV